MCGIWCLIGHSDTPGVSMVSGTPGVSMVLEECLRRRGPDGHRTWTNGRCSMGGFVLEMHGHQSQPMIGKENATALCFNGEIYGPEKDFDVDQSDTSILFDKLNNCDSIEEIVHLLVTLKGPWSLIYHRWNKVIIGRDVFGRRSLIYQKISNRNFLFSSVVEEKFSTSSFDIPSGSISVIDLSMDHDGLWDVYAPKSICSLLISALPAHRLHSIDYSHLLNPTSRLPEISSSNENFIVSEFIRRFVFSVERRIRRNPSASIAILFSGGVDSLLIAMAIIALEITNIPIDLINVAFEMSDTNSFDVPDRVSGRKAFNFLRSQNPKIQFRLVETNVRSDELSQRRKDRIGQLIRPANTVLDDSIGCVLWFAARGSGISYPDGIPYTSTARIVLIGSGSDELLAGYSRHRTRYREDGRMGLLAELGMELARIGNRTLSRDDRVVADHGKELRLPFLDEDLVEWINRLPLESKADLSLERGVGEKILIRRALRQLGAPGELAGLPKRAMQFGTRIAKLENRKEKGGDRCDRLFIDNAIHPTETNE